MFWNVFVELCNKNKVTPNAVCKELGFSNATATKWKNGSEPRDTTYQKVSEYFGVSVDYLRNKSDEKEKAPAGDTDEELNEYLEFLRTDPNYRMMFSLMKGATKEDVEKAVKVIKSLLGED